MQINRIKKRLQEIIEESERQLEMSNKAYETAVEGLDLLITEYRSRLRQRSSMYVRVGLDGMNYVTCTFYDVLDMLKAGLEKIKFEDSRQYRGRKAVAESLLKNLQNTFGTQERPKGDIANRLDCINDINKYFGTPQNINFPYDAENIYSNFTPEEREMFKERKMSRDVFTKAILRMIDNPPVCIENRVIRDETLSRWQKNLRQLITYTNCYD